MTTYDITLEHPAGRLVLADWATILYPLDKWVENGLDVATSVKFRRSDGQLFEAYQVDTRGAQAVVVKIACSWDGPSPIIQGDLIASAAAASLADENDYIDGSGVTNAANPTITGFTYSSTESLRVSTVEQVDRLIYVENATILANEGRKGIINLFRVKKHLHPVVDWFVQIVNQHVTDDVKLAFTLPDTTIDFGDGAFVRLASTSRWSEFADGKVDSRAVAFGVEGDSQVCIQDLLVHHGVAPSVHIRAHYTLDRDATADEDEEDYLSSQMRDLVEFDPPVGKYVLYGTNVTGGARWLTMGVIPNFTTDIMARHLTDAAAVLGDDERGIYKSIYTRRPHAQGWSTNASGTQRFGWSATGAVFGMNPYTAYRFLRLSAEDEQLRPCHWYEVNGDRVNITSDPTMITQNRNMAGNSPVRLGLGSNYTPPRVSPASTRTADDQQHVDDLTLHAFLALFDDPDLIETQRQIIDRESCDSRIQGGWINGAARGYGRPVFTLATAQWLMKGTAWGNTALVTLKAWIDNLETLWVGAEVEAGANPTGKIKPVRVVGPSRPDSRMPSFNPDTGVMLRTVVGYENATCVAALAAQAIVLDDDATRRATCLSIGGDVMHTVCETIIVDAGSDQKVPYYIGFPEGADLGVAVNPDWLDERQDVSAGFMNPGRSPWTRWAAAGLLMAQWYVDIGGYELTGKSLVDRLGAINYLSRDGSSDELYRFTAVPLIGTQAPLLPAV